MRQGLVTSIDASTNGSVSVPPVTQELPATAPRLTSPADDFSRCGVACDVSFECAEDLSALASTYVFSTTSTSADDFSRLGSECVLPSDLVPAIPSASLFESAPHLILADDFSTFGSECAVPSSSFADDHSMLRPEGAVPSRLVYAGDNMVSARGDIIAFDASQDFDTTRDSRGPVAQLTPH